MQARVYFNLHKRQLSIQTQTPKGWRVTQHSPAIILSNAKFKVSESGRQRVLREQRKNVHAMVEGEIFTADSSALDRSPIPVKYNPYKAAFFFNARDGSRIDSAALVEIRAHNGYSILAVA